MKIFKKLKPQKVIKALKSSDGSLEEIITDETIQYYKITETKEIVEENITTLENFESIIVSLEEKKQKLIEEIDAEIAYNQEILNELKKL